MLISFAVTAKLICVFVFAFAKSWFSHNEAHIYDLVIVLHSNCRKKWQKHFKNRSTYTNLIPKIDLDLVFCMCKGGNPFLVL